MTRRRLQGSKCCPKCHEEKPRAEFRSGWCRSCRLEYNRRFYQSRKLLDSQTSRRPAALPDTGPPRDAREAVVMAIGSRGVGAQFLHPRLAWLPPAQIDAIVSGLIRAGIVQRIGTLLTPVRRLTTHGRCSCCGEVKPSGWLLDTGICLTCASEQTVALERRALREQAEPEVTPERAVELRRRKRDETRARRDRLRAQGCNSRGTPTWEAIQKRIREIETTPRAGLSSGSSSRCSSGSSPVASGC